MHFLLDLSYIILEIRLVQIEMRFKCQIHTVFWRVSKIYLLLDLLIIFILCIEIYRQHIKKQRHYFANKGPSSQSYGFSTSHVWMWELDCKESWALKNWCFWAVVLDKTLESPLDCKKIQPVHPKGDQSWMFIARTDAEAETPILWLLHVKNWLIGKDPAAGKEWRQEEKGMTEDEMVGWHHWLDEHEFEQALGVGDGQGTLASSSPRGYKELDTNWVTELMYRNYRKY